MDHDLSIYPYGRMYRWEEVYLAVSEELVDHIMDVLRAHLARSWPEGGLPTRDDEGEHRLVATTCSALGGLVEAHAAHHHRHGGRELVLMIQDFMSSPPPKARQDAPWRDEEHLRLELDSLRDDKDVEPAVLDALLALRAQLVTQHLEHASRNAGAP